jgi:RNA polymerase sigma factor (sigma-70 family)
MDERELLSRCIAGDEKAWRQFLKSYDRCVYGAILRLLGKFSVHEAEVAEDIFAGVIEKLLTDDCAALRRFKGNSKLTTWLVSIARNKTYDYLRGCKRRPTVSMSSPLDADQTDLEDLLAADLDLDYDLEVKLTVGEVLKMLPVNLETPLHRGYEGKRDSRAHGPIGGRGLGQEIQGPEEIAPACPKKAPLGVL